MRRATAGPRGFGAGLGGTEEDAIEEEACRLARAARIAPEAAFHAKGRDIWEEKEGGENFVNDPNTYIKQGIQVTWA